MANIYTSASGFPRTTYMMSYVNFMPKRLELDGYIRNDTTVDERKREILMDEFNAARGRRPNTLPKNIPTNTSFRRTESATSDAKVSRLEEAKLNCKDEQLLGQKLGQRRVNGDYELERQAIGKCARELYSRAADATVGATKTSSTSISTYASHFKDWSVLAKIGGKNIASSYYVVRKAARGIVPEVFPTDYKEAHADANVNTARPGNDVSLDLGSSLSRLVDAERRLGRSIPHASYNLYSRMAATKTGA